MEDSIYSDMLGNNYSAVTQLEKPLGVHIHYGKNGEPVDFYSIFQLVETPNMYEYMGKKYRIPTIPTSSVPYRAHLAPGSYDVIALLHVFENEFLVVRGIEIPSVPLSMGNINSMVNENKSVVPYIKPSQPNLTLAETITEYVRMLNLNLDNKNNICKSIADLVFLQKKPTANLYTGKDTDWISINPGTIHYSQIMEHLKTEEKIHAKNVINQIIEEKGYNPNLHKILEYKTNQYIICQLSIINMWGFNVHLDLPLEWFVDEMFSRTSHKRYTDGVYEYELQDTVSVKCNNEAMLGTGNIVAIINKNNVFIYFRGYIVDLIFDSSGNIPKTVPQICDAFHKMPVLQHDNQTDQFTNFPEDRPNVTIKRIAPNRWIYLEQSSPTQIVEKSNPMQIVEQSNPMQIVEQSSPMQEIEGQVPELVILQSNETKTVEQTNTDTVDLKPLTAEERIDQLEKALAFKNNLQSQNFLMDLAKQSCYDASWMLIDLAANISQQDNGFMLYLKRVGEKTNRNNIMHCFKIPKTLVDVLVSCGIQMTTDLNCVSNACTKARLTVVFDGMRYAPMILFWNADIIIGKLDMSSYFYANANKFQKILADFYKKENLLDL